MLASTAAIKYSGSDRYATAGDFDGFIAKNQKKGRPFGRPLNAGANAVEGGLRAHGLCFSAASATRKRNSALAKIKKRRSTSANISFPETASLKRNMDAMSKIDGTDRNFNAPQLS